MDDSVFFALLDQLYELPLRPERWIEFLEALSHALHGKAALFIQDSGSSKSSVGGFARFDPHYIASYVERYGAGDIWRPSVARLRPGEIMRGEDVMSASEAKRTTFYREWLRPQNLLHSVVLMLKKEGPLTTQLTVLRSEAAGSFSPSELALMERLSVHARRALAFHHELTAARIQRDCALMGADGLALGLIIVDTGSRVLFLNAVAEQVLRRGMALTVSQGRLCAGPPRSREPLSLLVSKVAGMRQSDARWGGGLLTIPTEVGRSPLSLLVAPLPASSGARFGFDAPAAAIFLNDPASEIDVKESDLGRLYGLTTAEAKLLESLLAGVNISDYAANMRITVNTAKTYLKQIFAKTSRSRQSELIREVLANPIARLARRVDTSSPHTTNVMKSNSRLRAPAVNELMEQASRQRLRAEEYRAAMEQMQFECTRATYRRLAENCEAMARRLEEIAAGDRRFDIGSERA